jgi:hypothetical protein
VLLSDADSNCDGVYVLERLAESEYDGDWDDDTLNESLDDSDLDVDSDRVGKRLTEIE